MHNKIIAQKNLFFLKQQQNFLKLQKQKIIKPGKKTCGLCYIDGLVSTGKKFPYTILKINFAL
jgi:hypothetical protein